MALFLLPGFDPFQQFRSRLIVRAFGDGFIHAAAAAEHAGRTLSFDDDFKKSFARTAEIYEKCKLSACLIFNTHGLDEEGWGPIRAAYLERLLERLLTIDTVEILPAGRAVAKYAS